MPEQRNLILAVVLSVTIIIGFQYFYELPRIQEEQRRQAAIEESTGGSRAPTPSPASSGAASSANPAAPGSVPTDQPLEPSRDSVLAEGERITIDNGRLTGSLGVTGGRIDDIVMTNYQVSMDANAENVTLFNPAGSPDTYFAEFGWAPEDTETVVPDQNTVWSADRKELRSDQPVTLSWENGQGLIFERRLEIDDNYLITITQRVRNQGEDAVTLYPYGLVRRWGTPEISGFFILHEGPMGVFSEQLNEVDYSDLAEDNGEVEQKSDNGWLGISDKYWLAALIPDQTVGFTAKFQHYLSNGEDRYQTDYLRPAVTVPAGGSAEATDRLFAGAKELDKLDAYAAEFNIPLFDRAIDFGWFYWLTKPIFYILHFFYGLVGNYGVAILLLTLVVKLIFFPLANKSYRSMSGMKKLQPEMTRIREQAGDDKMRMQKEMMELYKKEKVNPMSGCLPILVQIPVFFALYKVLFVSIEMRHAPFFGWIQDLSAPDPTSLFNLFGLLPFDPPSFLMIGIWPLLMGITMFLQTRLNPQPADPVQAKVMLFLPLMFIFLFATFAAGLVIYWTWNNVLSIAQQWVIMRRMGVKI
ncbi:MAG: membrane protein insertase YidC [Alphaproteobacteria bacterium]|nr:membrane protein insertase YidC [Alphaproteobacteria bacterium]